MVHSSVRKEAGLLLGLVSIAVAAPAPSCPEEWSGSAIAEVVARADASLARLDPAGLSAARDLLLAALPCLGEPLTGAEAGAVHRVLATAAFADGDEARLLPALAGLVAADPGFQLPLDVYPEGHPLRRALPEAGRLAREPGARALAAADGGSFVVDGLPGAAAPAVRAAVVHRRDAAGEVVETRYLWPDDPLLGWEPVVAPMVAEAPRRGRARVPLAVATAASVVAGGVLYGLARTEYDTFHDPAGAWSDAELVAKRDRANGYTVGWVGAGVLSVGLGVGLVAAW